MPWGAIASIGTSVLGGVLGQRDADAAFDQQMGFINEARSQFGEARNSFQLAHDGALSSIDEANMLLAGIEPAVLAGMDEQLRVAFANQLIQQEQDQAQLRSQMASAGLDATTAMQGVQRSQRFGQAQALGNVGASFAGQRAGMIANARQGVAQGYMNRANAIQNFGSQMANTYMGEAGLLAGIQVQPANTGAAVGQIGAGISNALFQESLLDLLNGGGRSSAAANLGTQYAGQVGAQAGMQAMSQFLMGGFG